MVGLTPHTIVELEARLERAMRAADVRMKADRSRVWAQRDSRWQLIAAHATVAA